MDERCHRFHAKLLSGTCPWCGAAVVNGEVTDGLTCFDQSAVDFTSTECELELSGSGCESLYQLVIDKGQLDRLAALKYIRQVANQLEQIHSVAGFHGCIHPENIFVGEKGEAILGFGGLPLIDQLSSAGIVFEEMVVRSRLADYLAPEQALNSAETDQRSDIYSLGCTVYFLLVGTPPFGDGSISETLLKHQTAIPTPINQLRPDVPKELAQICMKMLAKKPVDRYQTTAEVVAALAGVE